MKILIIPIVVYTGLFSATSYSASFDCGKARTKTEIAICDNPSLGKLDEQLASTYRQALQTGGEKLRLEQREWLKRVATCPDIRCINDLYVARITELSLPPSNGSSQTSRSVQQDAKTAPAGSSSKASTGSNRLGF